MRQTKQACYPAPSVANDAGGSSTGNESFVTVNDDTATLPNSRQLAAGTGISVTDGGAGDPITVANTLPENTSVANVGTGTGQSYRDMTGDQINLKTVKAGTGIGVANNADDITVSNSAPESTSVANAGTGTGQVYKDMTGTQINLKTIKEGIGIDVSNDTNEVTITCDPDELDGMRIPVLNDAFTDAAAKPFWTNTGMFTSGDWQFSAANDRLEGIAQNNQTDWYRQGIEGDFDHIFKYTASGAAASVGMNFTGNSLAVSGGWYNDQFYFGATGKSTIFVNSTTLTFWVRVVRKIDDFTMYYRIGDTDPWIFVGTHSDLNLGHDTLAEQDSAYVSSTSSYILRALLYDNSFNGSATKAKFVKVIPLTDAATIAVDASLGNLFTVTLGGNRTLGAPTNPKLGQMIVFRITQDGTGGRTLAYNAIYRFSTDIPSPTLSTGIGKTDYLGFIYNLAANKWDCTGKVFGF